MTVCSRSPGIDPATFAADVAAAAQQLATSRVPETEREPRLRCYVFADRGDCRRRRFG